MTLPLVAEAWEVYDPSHAPVAVEEISAAVSTNRVYRLRFAERPSVFAKVSSFGSFVHFRQDHQRIERFRRLLAGSRYQELLAPVLTQGDDVFTYHTGESWVAFYDEVPTRAFLPKVLSVPQLERFAAEIAALHRQCDALSSQLHPTWKTLGSDIANLFDQLGSPDWLARSELTRGEGAYLRHQCNLFLRNADQLGYHGFRKLPLLVDWNLSNFSVTDTSPQFSLYSRWDYDWFRIEPRLLDFYFCSRVVSDIGDRTDFSYLVKPLLQPRFLLFLRRYHEVFPLTPAELSFVKEAYRFFVLNYVVRSGEHFFRPDLHARLLHEAVEQYFPDLDRADFTPLLSCLHPES